MPATFAQRFIALVIDVIVVFIVSIPLYIVLGMMGFIGSAILGGDGNMMRIGGRTFTNLVIQFFYYGYFWSRNGQSPGKQMLNIRVESRDGGPLTFAAAGLRGSVGYWISGLVLAIGFIWAAFDAKQEAWHDKIFGTRVVQV